MVSVDNNFAFYGDVIAWACPRCDWLVANIVHESIKCDPKCPGCGYLSQIRYSDYDLIVFPLEPLY